MTHDQIVGALLSLRPGAQWYLSGATLDDLIWYDTTQSAPSADQVATWLTANPNGPAPQTVSMLNARRALRAAGLLDKVNAAIAAQSADVQDAWQFAVTIDRGSPTVKALGVALGLTDAQLDGLFVQAAGLPAL